MRIVLLVDSSSPTAQMLNHFRAGLNAFFDTLPPEHEVVFITTGGQIKIRAQPTTDRAALKTAADRFASDGGGNSFVETLMESDRRFLQKVPQWPVFVIVTEPVASEPIFAAPTEKIAPEPLRVISSEPAANAFELSVVGAAEKFA